MLKRVLLLIVMLLLLCLVIFFNEQSNKQPNVVSHQKKVEQVINQNIDAQNKPAKNVNNTDETPELLLTTNVINKSPRTFLQVYQDLQLANECNTFYTNNHQQKGSYDYVSELRRAFQSMNKTDDLPPVEQLDALEYFVQSCQDLKVDVFARGNINEEFPEYQFAYPVVVELRKELRQTNPQTPVEKHLSETIRLSKQWQQQFKQLTQTARGELKHSSSVIKMMQDEAQSIRNTISSMYQAIPVDGVKITELEQQMANLYKQMEERLPASEAAMNQARENFKPINTTMENNLKTIYPYSFKETIKTLQVKDRFDLRVGFASNHDLLAFYLKHHISWHQPPSHLVMNQSQITDVDHFNLLVEPASLLYLCYLGDDCGPNSAHVRKYCLNNQSYFQPTYPDACGKTLIDFYTEDYLTENQWIDVSWMFDVMVDMYAQ